MFIQNQADMFFNAFEILQESDEVFAQFANSPDTAPVGKKFGRFSTMQVEVVCLSLSVELYVKALHTAIFNDLAHGHNILELFRKLPENVQQTIFSFPSISKYGWNFSQFEEEIKAISNSFTQWRYSYEVNSLRFNTYFAKVFVEALISSIDSLHSHHESD